MKLGRPIKYFTEEERLKAIRESKTKYMLNKPWYCNACSREYPLAGKWTHLHTKKHLYNQIITDLKADNDIDLVFDD